MKPIYALFLFLLIIFIIAFTGSQFQAGDWYESLRKPAFNPPSWIFGPVWTILYIMIAISGWLVWKDAGFTIARSAFITYGIQLILNATWSALFFGLHKPGIAFVGILALWFFILLNILAFWRINRTAGILLIPYHAWVTFAAVLNGTLWFMND